jgi:uncharacterized repeat protein (TIGR03943 family)
MRLDPTRLLRGLGILAWALFFDYLWLAGKASTYVGPRTTWVVTFGAITLTLVALVYLASTISRRPGTPLTAAEVGRLGVIVAPLLLAVMVPAVSLGAQAVGQKRTADGATSLARLGDYDGEIRLYELAAAAFDKNWAAQRGIKAGLKVQFDGFVSRAARNGQVEVSRFMATCCAADAVPYSVQVKQPADALDFKTNQWVLVRGTVTDDPKRTFVITADKIEAADRPSNPYG